MGFEPTGPCGHGISNPTPYQARRPPLKGWKDQSVNKFTLGTLILLILLFTGSSIVLDYAFQWNFLAADNFQINVNLFVFDCDDIVRVLK